LYSVSCIALDVLVLWHYLFGVKRLDDYFCRVYSENMIMSCSSSDFKHYALQTFKFQAKQSVQQHVYASSVQNRQQSIIKDSSILKSKHGDYTALLCRESTAPGNT